MPRSILLARAVFLLVPRSSWRMDSIHFRGALGPGLWGPEKSYVMSENPSTASLRLWRSLGPKSCTWSVSECGGPITYTNCNLFLLFLSEVTACSASPRSFINCNAYTSKTIHIRLNLTYLKDKKEIMFKLQANNTAELQQTNVVSQGTINNLRK